jgi:hypothetical protein
MVGVALAAVGYGLLLTWVWWASRQDQRVSADTIVVLGAALAAGMPLALAVMHLAWGGAFWWGWLTSFRRGTSESRGT